MSKFITTDEIKHRFGYHQATEETKGIHEAVRAAFMGFVDDLFTILEEVPDGREKSLVLTSLEEASFWANAGVARNLAPLV